MYTALYSMNQVVSRRGDLLASMATLRSILQSSFFLGFNAYSVILVFCLSRRFLGKFYYVVAAHLPAIIGSYLSIQLERKSRRPALSFYVANVASETLWNKVVSKGWLHPMPHGDVVLFGLSTASLLYLMHRNGFGKDPVSFGFRFLLGKDFIEDPLKSRRRRSREEEESYMTSSWMTSEESEDSAVESGKTSPESERSCQDETLLSEVHPNRERETTWSVNDIINIETSDKQTTSLVKRRGSESAFEGTINDHEVTTSETESLEGSQDSSTDFGCCHSQEDGIKGLKSTKKKREEKEDKIILTPLTANHCLINGQGIINFSCPHSILGKKKTITSESKGNETTRQTKEFVRQEQQEASQGILKQYMKGMSFLSCLFDSVDVELKKATPDAPLTSTSSSRKSLSSSLYSSPLLMHPSSSSCSSPLFTTLCLQDCLVMSLRNFLIAYAGHSAVTLFMRPKALISQPIKSLMEAFVMNRKSLRLALFLSSFTLLFKTSNCLLRNVVQPRKSSMDDDDASDDCLLLFNREDHYPKLTFLSGLIASSSMLFYPSSTTGQYMMWKLIETVYFLGVKSGKVKAVDFTMNMLYAVSTAQLFYVAVMEPHLMRKSYTKFLNRVTRGAFAKLNRNIIDIFGTQSSSGYDYYEPVLQLDHMSNKFKESVLVWMIWRWLMSLILKQRLQKLFIRK